MKLFSICILIILPYLCYTHPVVEEVDEGKAIIVDDSDHAESENSQIAKRSGPSFDIVQSIKSSVLSGVGRASASFASASSGGSGGYKSVGGEHANSVSFDPLSLKKSILSTIFQAVKAITGGVTAIKGQLLKGSGYALAAGGKLVAVSGDKVTDVGKAIVSSAHLGPPSSGGHPLLGKLSGLSGGSSGSGGHPVISAPAHSETITTYEIPSGHGSYGPPSKPPSYGSTAYLPPGAFGGGAHFTGAAAFEGPSGWPSKYGFPIEGYSEHYGPLDPRQAHSAAEALKEIVHLLPLTKTKPLPITTKKPVTVPPFKQYPIPKYPFSDLKPFQIETISQSQTLTTALGSPLVSDGENLIAYENYGPNVYKSHPWDVYNSMAHKYKSNKRHRDYRYGQQSYDSLTPVIAALATKNHKGNGSSSFVSLDTASSQNHPSFLPPPVVPQSHVSKNFSNAYKMKSDYRHKHTTQHTEKRKSPEIYRSPGFQIGDPVQFNRLLLY